MEHKYESAIYKKKDVTGSVFGSYLVLGKIGIKKFPSGNTHHIWAVRCNECGEEKVAQAQHVISAKYGCSSCKGRQMSGRNSCHWRGGQHVPAYFISKCKAAATRRSRTIEWNLSIQYLDDLWKDQNQRCAYTDWPLDFGKSKVLGSASLDRIDSSLGYIEGNVQFVHKDVNIMKWGLSDSRFREICEAISKKGNNKC